MSYKAAIFDMDGTLLNTLEDIADSLNYCLKQYGLPERSLEEIRAFVGNGIHRTIEKAAPEGTASETVENVFELFNEYYKEHCEIKTGVYEGIKELIEGLKTEGILLAVVSNKEDGAVRLLCDKYYPGIFDYSVGNKPELRRKPYPDSVLEVLRYFGISDEDALYIGDSEVDYETARSSGLDVALITWGFRAEAYLRSLKPEYIIRKPEELGKIITGRL